MLPQNQRIGNVITQCKPFSQLHEKVVSHSVKMPDQMFWEKVACGGNVDPNSLVGKALVLHVGVPDSTPTRLKKKKTDLITNLLTMWKY